MLLSNHNPTFVKVKMKSKSKDLLKWSKHNTCVQYKDYKIWKQKHKTIIPHETYWYKTYNFTAYLAILQNHHRHPGIDLCVVNISMYLSMMHSAVQDPQSILSTTNLREQTRRQTVKMQPTVRTTWTVQEPDSMQSKLSSSPRRQFKPLLLDYQTGVIGKKCKS